MLDFAIFNKTKPEARILRKYKRENAELVDPTSLNLGEKKLKYIITDLIDHGPFVRHNPRKKLAKVLLSLV